MTPTIDTTHPFVTALHAAVASEYDCDVSALTGLRDTDAKLMAVFLLYRFGNAMFKRSHVAVTYKIAYLYIPTVIDFRDRMYGVDEGFRQRVKRILDKMESDEKLDA